MFNGEVEFTCQNFQDCFLMVLVLGLDIAKYEFHSLVIVLVPTKNNGRCELGSTTQEPNPNPNPRV